MVYRIKCKLCLSVIEYGNDITSCKCGEITLHGPTQTIACRKEQNYSEIDDEGHEVQLTEEKLDKIKKLDMLDEMIKSYEALPQSAMNSPITHYDLISVLLLLASILRED